VTPRAKALLAGAVLDEDRSVAAVAGDTVGAPGTPSTSTSSWVADSALAGEPEAGDRARDRRDPTREGNGKPIRTPVRGRGWTGGTPDWSI